MNLGSAKVASKRKLLLLVGVFVLAYAVAVLLHVSATPDIGLQCGFSSIIKQADPHFFRGGEDQIEPQPGDVLEQVGPFQFSHDPEEKKRPKPVQVLILKALLFLRDEGPT